MQSCNNNELLIHKLLSDINYQYETESKEYNEKFPSLSNNIKKDNKMLLDSDWFKIKNIENDNKTLNYYNYLNSLCKLFPMLEKINITNLLNELNQNYDIAFNYLKNN